MEDVRLKCRSHLVMERERKEGLRLQCRLKTV